MKKKVLFVDDEVMVLQGLQQMLCTMGQEWEFEFAESGADALARMVHEPFDAVVADMRMPSMTGAEFLNEVMRQHPKMVRLIVSEPKDADYTNRCVGSTHDARLKPLSHNDLEGSLQRATMLDRSFQDRHLVELVDKIDRLPSIPDLYFELVEVMHNPEAGIADVGTIIAKDMAMTAKILKLVNSAFFGLQQHVSTPVEATSYLGMDTIRSLVLSLHAFEQYEAVKIEGFSVESLWTHSLETAAAAKLIAAMEGCEKSLVDQAFVAGMLHDLGKLVLASNFAPQYTQVVKLTKSSDKPMAEVEEEIFGVSHAEVGGCLLGFWGLPVPVVEAIALHHQPQEAGSDQFSPLTAVHVANALGHHHGGLFDLGSASVNWGYLEALGLKGRAEQWWKEIKRCKT